MSPSSTSSSFSTTEYHEQYSIPWSLWSSSIRRSRTHQERHTITNLTMFELTSSIMMRRTSSTDSTSSTSSLSLSPTGWSPSRATMSPPSVTSYPSTIKITSEFTVIRPTTPESRMMLSPEPSRLNLSTSNQAYAFPSWPVRDSLTPPLSQQSPTSCYFSPNYIPNSRISDDDLAALDFTKQKAVAYQPDEAVLGLSWSAVNNPSSHIVPALQVCERRLRLPPPPAQYRRRSSSRRSPSRKSNKTLVAIAE